MAVNVGETVLAALKFVGELGVVDAELVEEGGVKVVDVDGFLVVLGGVGLDGSSIFVDEVVAEVIGLAEGGAGLDAAAGGPEGEAAGMVVATVVLAGELALAVRSSSEFTTPDDERVVEESSHFEVLDEGGGGLVGVVALAGELFGKGEMLVPAHVVELHEADIALGEAACHEAIVGVSAALFDLGSIHVEDGLGFIRDVGELGDRGLHAVGELVLLDAGVDFGVGKFGELLFVQLGEVIEHFAAGLGRVARWIGKVEDGVSDGHELHAGVFGGEEAGAPESVVEWLAIRTAGAAGDHGDEVGKVFVFGSEAVGKPGSHGGAAGDLRTGLKEGDGGVVVNGLGIHRADEADVIGNPGDVGEEFGDFGAGLAVFFEFVFGAGDGKGLLPGGHAGFPLVEIDEFAEFFAVVFLELGFVVEEILGGRGAALEEVDHALGLGGGFWGGFSAEVLAEHGGESSDTDAGGRPAEEVASVDEELGLGEWIVHWRVGVSEIYVMEWEVFPKISLSISSGNGQSCLHETISWK